MSVDPFGPAKKPTPSRCTECGGYDGAHFVNCDLMREQETEKMLRRNGVCTKCHLVKPCDC